MKRFLSSLLSPDPLGASPQILVFQLRRIGEVILTTPALQLLRETWPNARITLVMHESTSELAPTLPKVDEVLVFHPTLRSNRVLFKRLLTGSFDLCLDFTGTDRTALYALLSRARRRVAFTSARKGPLRALVYQNFVQVDPTPSHTVDQLLQLLRPTGIPLPEGVALPCLTVPALAQHRIRHLLSECGISGEFALIHPGTALAEKYWLPERWAEVILHLQLQHQLPCVLTGGPDPFEQEHLRSIQTAIAMLGNGPLPLPMVALSGQLDLSLLTALVARTRLAVCCDTAVVHMASAFRRPQITLFGPTNPFEWRPRHDQSLVISAESPLQPMADGFQFESPGAPMSAIPTPTVTGAIDSLLQAPKAPKAAPTAEEPEAARKEPRVSNS